MTTELPLRDDLSGLEPYGAPQLHVRHLLNVNENPYGPSAQVIGNISQAVATACTQLHRYPDRDFLDLRRDLATFLEGESEVAVSADQVWAANGSNEVMLHAFQAFGGPGRTAVSFGPTYAMYPEYARDTVTEWVLGQRRTDFTIDVAAAIELITRVKPAIVLLTSPNNPTGTSLALADTAAICRAAASVQVPGTQANPVIIVDEAYAEFRRDGVPSALELLSEFPNLAVSRTMSKAFALAGARLGYLIAAPKLIDALRIVRLPYHLSAVTQAVARVALAHSSELLGRVDDLRRERDATVTWLQEQGFEVAPTDANFVYFGRFADRHAVWQGLLDRQVLIRETGPDGWLRVSIGTAEDMAAFRTALLEVTR